MPPKYPPKPDRPLWPTGRGLHRQGKAAGRFAGTGTHDRVCGQHKQYIGVLFLPRYPPRKKARKRLPSGKRTLRRGDPARSAPLRRRGHVPRGKRGAGKDKIFFFSITASLARQAHFAMQDRRTAGKVRPPPKRQNPRHRAGEMPAAAGGRAGRPAEAARIHGTGTGFTSCGKKPPPVRMTACENGRRDSD